MYDFALVGCKPEAIPCRPFTACCKCLSMVSRERPRKQIARSSTKSLYLDENYTKPAQDQQGHCCHVHRKFIFIRSDVVNRNRPACVPAKGVSGTRKLHSEAIKRPGVIYTRELSCYCTHCYAGFPGQYTQQLYPKLRQEHSLMPVQISRHPRPPENPTAAPPAAEFNLRVEFDLENSNSDHEMVSNFPWIDWVYERHVKNKFEIADPWHGIAFRITGPLWRESMGHWWILED